MCEYAAGPVVKWYSLTDQTNTLFGITCTALERRPPGTSWRSWYSWVKIAELIQGFPW